MNVLLALVVSAVLAPQLPAQAAWSGAPSLPGPGVSRRVPTVPAAGQSQSTQLVTNGVVLWDQSELPLVATYAYVDAVQIDDPGFDIFMVNDVSTNGETWSVKQVTTYFTTTSGYWDPASITQARLQVYPKTGSLPLNGPDIAPEYTVPATLSLVGLSWEVSADTSGVAELQGISGDFWIGLTPITEYRTDGTEFHWVARDSVGSQTAFRNPGGGYGLGTSWTPLANADVPVVAGPPYELTIKLCGDVLVPNGAVLWDQSTTPLVDSWNDQAFTDFPSYDTFQVNDVSTNGQTWSVKRVSTYFTTEYGSWGTGGITQAKLQVYPKTGSLPLNGPDIAPEYTVPATLIPLGISWELLADTSGVAELQGISGDFWIGLTPITDFATQGQEYHWVASTSFGNQTAFRNPGDAFGYGTDWAPLADFDVPVVTGPPYELTIKLVGDVSPGSWTNLGFGLAGVSGIPVLTGMGMQQGGNAAEIDLANAKPSSPAALFVGLSSAPAPFKGGMLVPVPSVLLLAFTTLPDGTLPLPFAWPSGLPSAFSIYYQYAISDTAAVKKVALSNALRSMTP